MRTPSNAVRILNENRIRYKFSLTFFFTLFSLLAISQTDFRPGYYITWENDTIYGLIDYRGEIRNSAFCEFKESQNVETQRFSPEEIQAYRFIDSKYYISKKISLSEGEKQVFLEFLLNGITNLYFYRNINNYQYFIEAENGSLRELKNPKVNEYVEGIGTRTRETNEYIGVLKATLSDCNQIYKKIDKVSLDHKSLIDITKEYHDYMCDDQQCIIYEKRLTQKIISLAPVVGGGLARIYFDKDYAKFDFENSSFPSLGLLIKIAPTKFNEKLSIDIETDINKYNFKGSYTYNSSFKTDYYNTQIDIISFQPSVSLKYTVPGKKINPTFALGVYSNFFVSTDQQMTKRNVTDVSDETFDSKNIPLANNVFGFQMQIGCEYKILNEHKIFTVVKICKKALKEAGVSTFFDTINFGIGVYLTKDD